MASNYSSRHSKPLGVNAEGWAGAGRNLGVEALAGGTDLITVLDDFDSIVNGVDTFGGAAIFEDSNWVLTDAGAPVVEEITMNDPGDVDQWSPSCIRIFVGTADDAGGSMQLDLINGTMVAPVSTADFPHLWIPETAAGAGVLDDTVWVFACRIGLRADLTTTGAGDWNSKAFIGWAEAGDTGIMAPTTGAITNGAVTAGDTMWFDLALRMTITNMSDVNANGATEFFHRRVPATTGPPGNRDDELPGQGTAWTRHPTVLLNQTPNNDVALVPTIEVINGPTAGRDGVFFLDWWAFGCSRFSRLSR